MKTHYEIRILPEEGRDVVDWAKVIPSGHCLETFLHLELNLSSRTAIFHFSSHPEEGWHAFVVFAKTLAVLFSLTFKVSFGELYKLKIDDQGVEDCGINVNYIDLKFNRHFELDLTDLRDTVAMEKF